MNIIVPIGGLGVRFKESGYTTPKPLVKALGKEIIQWVLDSLPPRSNIFIAYNQELDLYNFSNFLGPSIKSFPLDRQTCGSAETVKLCLEYYGLHDQPFVAVDCDSFLSDSTVLSSCYGKNAVVCFPQSDESNVYSYYRIGLDGHVDHVAEKVKISPWAGVGVYAFRNAREFLEAYDPPGGEYFMSSIVRQMLDRKFEIIQCLESQFHCLGTPWQLRCFCNNVPRVPCTDITTRLKPIRVCFDLDNTLVTPPTVPGDYSTCGPLTKNIEFCRYLKKLGNTVIIHTARRMKTHGGNLGRVNRDIGQVTFETLEKLEIPYDEIYFGKPYADIYIDDKACDPNFVDLKTGFYNTKIVPRSFNTVTTNGDQVTKTSRNLSSEIYYYMNVPDSIKDLFPLLISSSDPGSYTIERVNGVTVSEMFTVQGSLSIQLLDAILGSLRRIHDIPCTNPNFDIRDIYSRKLVSRGVQCDPELLEYEQTVTQYTCVHGDPVFTNILVNNYGKLKFIDPRGSIGNCHTLYGDPMYDWAKVYQSLLGYDFILADKPPRPSADLLKFFESQFTPVQMRNIKIICRSLVQSLIPLHEEHHKEFIRLYQSIDGVSTVR